MKVTVNSNPDVSSAKTDIEQEIDSMLSKIKEFDLDLPDIVMKEALAYMARCTEIHVFLVRIEASNRRAKYIRTMQLEKVMGLLQEYFRGASRMIEVRRQEIELSR